MTSIAEQWLPIPGYEGLYDVSDLGRVRSWHRWKDAPIPHVLDPKAANQGYLFVALRGRAGERPQWPIHQLVLLAFVGPRSQPDVRHLDGNRQNNALLNLAYGTRSENIRDAVRQGTHTNAAKVACPRDHPYDQANTYYDKRGGRYCRECRNEGGRRSRRLARSTP